MGSGDGTGRDRNRRLLVSASAAVRVRAAVDWLAAGAPDDEVLVVGASWEACDEVAREAARAAGARFGLVRFTLDRLAGQLAARPLAAEGRAAASALSFAALTARAIHHLRRSDRLAYYAPVAERPGFALAVARTLADLRMNGVPAAALARLEPTGVELAALDARIARELEDAGLADRALVFAAAVRAAGATPAPHPVGLRLVLLDLPVASAREVELLAVLAARAPATLATAPLGDEPAIRGLTRALACEPDVVAGARAARSLDALQAHLFADTAAATTTLDDSVTLASSPGEARECVEIARRIQAEAARGVPFDRMAIFLHAPGEYTVHLEEALERAGVPAFFARGTTRPHPAGRALLALLACAAEKLSARRFAEYLSLAQVPDPGATSDPAADFVPPADDLLGLDVEAVSEGDGDDPALRDPDAAAVVAGTLRAPWRWEKLIVEAAVIGRVERWERRLAGLAAEIERRRDDLVDDEARRLALERQLLDLRHLRDFALPLIRRLDALPSAASWGEWLAVLQELATAALRRPEPVLAALAELEPMAPVGPVDLDEVQLVLAPRLRELAVVPPRRRYGAVFVAPAAAARGLAFDVVFVPGLAEKLFPRKIVEDPILPDADRLTLAADLVTQPVRVAAERLALRLAVGTAGARVHLSYPRIDVEQARPRVPSFYALEALRAAEGKLPGFEELRNRAAETTGARLGWPAPRDATAAIDEAEYDLALLTPLVTGVAADATGAAHYLLSANPYLARALRARARRWLPGGWTVADGLVPPPADAGERPDRVAENLAWELARAALARHQIEARSFSPTALQHLAACPYRFFLQAIQRLEPRDEPIAIEAIDPLTRGALIHEVQFAILSALRADGLLPVRPATLARARAVADDALDAVAGRYHDDLAPAIERVWDDGIALVRADLYEWLERQAEATDGWVPHRFELSFGIVDRVRADADPASVREPVALDGGLKLRGAIDLVERRADGVLRATDYKTGRVWAKEGVIVGGGETLQPLFYALAVERLLGEPVESGRLYYCTADGGYSERVVRVDTASRAIAAQVVGVVARTLREGFLPAAPRPGACGLCDYRPVCGPLEEVRTARKPAARLADLQQLRDLR